MNLNELFEKTSEDLGLATKPQRATPEGAPPRLRVVGENNRDQERARKWLTRKVEEQVAELGAAPSGGRNHALNAIAYSLGRYIPKWLETDDVIAQLMYACRVNGLLDDDGEHQCRQTIVSGLTSGQLDPTDPPITPDDGTGGLAALGGIQPDQAAQAVEDAKNRTIDLTDAAEAGDEDAISALAHDHKLRVVAELATLRARHDAKQIHQAELATKTWRAPAYRATLTEELLIPEQPVSYAVEELLPAGGNALLAAQYKTGKTTFVTNLLRAYADGEPFLGRFQVSPSHGRIAIFNYELSEEQYRRWLRAVGIRNTDRVSVLHLRGYRLPLTSSLIEDWIVAWLKDHDVSMWIADPFARAATGTDENSNTDVGVWLDTFDVIKDRAGVRDAVLPTHTGRGEQEEGMERARGATRLDDWADVRWFLTKDDNDNRYFRATGRDVELDEAQLLYDPLTRLLTYGGGDRRWVRGRELAQRVLTYVAEHPGCGVAQIQNGVQGNKGQIDAARTDLIRRHKMRVEDGPRNALRHYANEVEA